MSAPGTEPTWRVYLREWLTVYTADVLGPAGTAECRDAFSRLYAGRVHEADWAIDQEGLSPARLRLRLWNRRGEFKDHGDALELASGLMDGHEDGPCDVLRRGSPEEQELLDYGKKKLPDAR